MKKLLLSLTFMLLPSLALADIAPLPDIPCEDCIYRCFDCCTMQEIAPMPGCGSCYRKACNFEPICADYLAKNPQKCPDRPKPAAPRPEIDENNLPAPELNDSDVDNTQPIADNTPQPAPETNPQPEQQPAANNNQVPPPVQNKRSCSAMMFASGQTGLWALLAAFVLGLSAFIVRRRCR